MNNIAAITPWAVEDMDGEFDMFLTTIGYERRARFVAETLRPRARSYVAYGFAARRVMSYRANLKWFQGRDYETADLDDTAFVGRVLERINGIVGRDGGPPKICVDISSMSRIRIAAILGALSDSRSLPGAVVDFVYAVAKYSPPAKEMSQIVSAGPVLPRYAGWSEEPDRRVTAVIGLGYEYDKAVGTLEFLEPGELWAFQATSADARYDTEAEAANKFLWEMLPAERRIKYHVTRPFDCFVTLESLLFGVLRTSRPVLVPFGPKIFTLCCLLAATVHSPKVAVWRVTSGENEPPVDHAADGTVVGLRVSYAPARSAATEMTPGESVI